MELHRLVVLDSQIVTTPLKVSHLEGGLLISCGVCVYCNVTMQGCIQDFGS